MDTGEPMSSSTVYRTVIFPFIHPSEVDDSIAVRLVQLVDARWTVVGIMDLGLWFIWLHPE